MIKALFQRCFKYVLFLLPLAGITFAVFFVMQAQSGAPEPQKVVEPTNKPAGTGIAASGIIEPVSQNIPIGAPVPGVVVEVIDFKKSNQIVHAGELLFRLDDRQLQSEKGIRKAALDAANAQMDKLKEMPRPEERLPYQARIDEAKAVLMEAEKRKEAADKLRAKMVGGQSAISLEDWGSYVRALEVAKFQKAKAEADLKLLNAGAWEADKKIQQVAIEQADAQLKQVQTELDRLEVRVPKRLDGYRLLFINVFEGQFVGAPPGQTLILLGNTKDGLTLRVDIDEHDVPRFKVDEGGETGPSAIATLRGEPRYKYGLEYVRLDPYIIPKKSLTGDNSERVDTRVLQVIYRIKDIPPGAPRLYVGQQMDVFIQSDAKK